MTVQSIFHVPGRGTVMQGPIESGSVRVGDRVEIRSPSNVVPARIRLMERTGAREYLENAAEGEDVCFMFETIDFSKLGDGVEFDENGQPHPIDLIVTRGSQPPRWWEFWK